MTDIKGRQDLVWLKLSFNFKSCISCYIKDKNHSYKAPLRYILTLVTPFGVTPTRKRTSHYEGLTTRGHIVVGSLPVFQLCQITHPAAWISIKAFRTRYRLWQSSCDNVPRNLSKKSNMPSLYETPFTMTAKRDPGNKGWKLL